MNEFGEKILSLRTEKNLTTKEVGHAVGIPQSRYSELEKGIRIPTGSQVERLEEFFGAAKDTLAKHFKKQ